MVYLLRFARKVRSLRSLTGSLFFQYQITKKQLKNKLDAKPRNNDESIHTHKQSSHLNDIMIQNQQILYCGSDCRHTYAISSTRVSVIIMFCV